jgi:hypothetical protein
VTVDKFITCYRVSTQRQGVSGLGLDAQKETVAKYVQMRQDCSWPHPPQDRNGYPPTNAGSDRSHSAPASLRTGRSVTDKALSGSWSDSGQGAVAWVRATPTRRGAKPYSLTSRQSVTV